jgi:hypothetical protein
MNEINRCLLLILLFLVCFSPALLFSQKKIIDPYNCITLACVEKSLVAGRIASINLGNFHYDPYAEGNLGYQAIIIIIAEICGLSTKEVAILPIGGIIVPFMFYFLARKLFNSDLLAAFFAIFIAFDPSLSPGHYNVFAYTWERPLLFIFIVLTTKILERGKKWENALLLFLVFVGTFYLYWTTPLIMIIFLFDVNFLLLIQILLGRQDEVKGKLTINSVLAFAVIYLAFNKVLYNDFLPAVVHEKYGTVTDALDQLLAWTGIATQSTRAEKYTATTSGDPLYDWILMFRYITMLIPIALYVVTKLINICREHKLRLNFDAYSYLFWPIILAILAQSIVYAARGHLSFRYASILFLPETLIALDRLKVKRLKVFTFLILLCLIFSGFSIILFKDYPGLNKSSDSIGNSAQFLFDKSSYNAKVLMDLNTFGLYLLEGISKQKTLLIKFNFYDSDIYGMIVKTERNNLGKTIDYVIVNKVIANSPTLAPGWKRYEPLSNYIEDINNNLNIHKIYDNGIWIFKTR